MWFGLHGGLPTKALLFRRKVLPSSQCDWCSAPVQSDLHVLRDCVNVLAVWKLLVPTDWWDMFCLPVNIVPWFRLNREFSSRNDSEGCHWWYIFRQTIHELWYSNNHRYHTDCSPLVSLALAEKSL